MQEQVFGFDASSTMLYQGVRVGVIPHDSGGFWLKIDGVAGKMNFPTMDEAKLRAFDVVQQRVARRQ